MADTKAAHTVPTGLTPSARKLFREIDGDYQLRIDEFRILEAACRTVDDITRLQTALVDALFLVAGSMGQDRRQPATCRALRDARAAGNAV